MKQNVGVKNKNDPNTHEAGEEINGGGILCVMRDANPRRLSRFREGVLVQEQKTMDSILQKEWMVIAD